MDVGGAGAGWGGGAGYGSGVGAGPSGNQYGANGTGTAQKKKNYLNDIYAKIDNAMNMDPGSNPIYSGASSWYNKVMTPGYNAMSQDQMNQEYNTRANDLVNNVFTPNENRWLTRQGSNAYSGTGRRYWQDQIANPENQALAGVKQDIYDKNFNTTQQNQQQALAMVPALSSMYNMPLNNAMQWAQLLTNKNAADRQAKAQSDSGLGGLLGGILPFFF